MKPLRPMPAHFGHLIFQLQPLCQVIKQVMLTISLFMTKLSLNLPKGDTFTLCNACRIDAEPQKRANEMKVTRVLNFYSEAILPTILSSFFHATSRCYVCIMRFSSFFKGLYDGNSSIQFWLLEFVVLQNFAFQFIHLSTYYLNTYKSLDYLNKTSINVISSSISVSCNAIK